MKKSKQTILYSFLLFLVFLVSCGKSEEQKNNLRALKTQVIAVHDTAMAKMGNMMMLQKKLTLLVVDSLDSAHAGAIKNGIVGLENAQKDMMDWMRNFSTIFPAGTLMGKGHENHSAHSESHETTNMDDEAMYELLEVELTKIQEVNADTHAAIDKANELLMHED